MRKCIRQRMLLNHEPDSVNGTQRHLQPHRSVQTAAGSPGSAQAVRRCCRTGEVSSARAARAARSRSRSESRVVRHPLCALGRRPCGAPAGRSCCCSRLSAVAAADTTRLSNRTDIQTKEQSEPTQAVHKMRRLRAGPRTSEGNKAARAQPVYGRTVMCFTLQMVVWKFLWRDWTFHCRIAGAQAHEAFLEKLRHFILIRWKSAGNVRLKPRSNTRTRNLIKFGQLRLERFILRAPPSDRLPQTHISTPVIGVDSALPRR